jgi:SAM-dependent methyltransferase
MSQVPFDEEMSRRLEVLYSTRDALRRPRLVRDAIAAAPGEHIMDVGCGPGFYLAELIDAVGPDGWMMGVDLSADMLAAAARRCEGHDNIELRAADATALPVDDASLDAAFSVQVLEYVPDVTAALAEMHRGLKQGGRLVVWDVDWATVSWRSSDQGRMTRVLSAWDEHLAHPSLPRTLAADMRRAGFADVQVEPYVFATDVFDAEAYGVAILPLVKDFVAGRAEVTADDAAAWAADQRDLGDRGEFFFTCTQFCFRGTKAA